jgi:predicted Rossmann fold flavoprotein
LEPTAPALVPLTFAPQDWGGLVDIAGLALPVRIGIAEQPKGAQFDEDLLFTHKGLSGPGVLQISSYWQPGQHLSINLIPEKAFLAELLQNKSRERRQLDTVLASFMPKRLVESWLNEQGWSAESTRPVNELGDAWLRKLYERLRRWQVCPNGSEGYRKAEVTRGGVACVELNSNTMEAKRQPGLHFIGEVVDMTGWLGGYNFQWAWASGQACGRSL